MLKRGNKLTVEAGGRKFTFTYQTKEAALVWAREAQLAKWRDAKELRELREEFSKADAPDLYTRKEKDPETGKMQTIEAVAPGSVERHLGLCKRVFEDCDQSELFDELLEGDEHELLMALALEVMERHSVSEREALA